MRVVASKVLYDLVYDPAFLVVAWRRVRANKGARTPGVDGVAPWSVGSRAEKLLVGLRGDLRARRFVPQRVRQQTIPKGEGKVRSLGIPTVADRVVQASLKLVLEPILGRTPTPCSYGFRPKRRAQDAIAEIHYLGSPTRSYEWVFEGGTSKRASARSTITAIMSSGRIRAPPRRNGPTTPYPLGGCLARWPLPPDPRSARCGRYWSGRRR